MKGGSRARWRRANTIRSPFMLGVSVTRACRLEVGSSPGEFDPTRVIPQRVWLQGQGFGSRGGSVTWLGFDPWGWGQTLGVGIIPYPGSDPAQGVTRGGRGREGKIGLARGIGVWGGSGAGRVNGIYGGGVGVCREGVRGGWRRGLVTVTVYVVGVLAPSLRRFVAVLTQASLPGPRVPGIWI